jgi:predicted nuclease with TOPRIM domain
MEEISKELCKERSEQTRRRLDKHSDTIDALKVCSVKLTEMVEIHNQRLSDHESRLDSLENRPSSILSKVIDALISAVVATLVCILL